MRLCYLCSMLASLFLLTRVPGSILLQCCMIHQCSQGQAIYALYFSGVKPNPLDLCQENTGAVDTILGLPNDIRITILELLVWINYSLPLAFLRLQRSALLLLLVFIERETLPEIAFSCVGSNIPYFSKSAKWKDFMTQMIQMTIFTHFTVFTVRIHIAVKDLISSF